MEKLIGPQGRIPEQFFREWLKVYIPGTAAGATFPIPPELVEYFEDCLYPPSILIYAKAVLETTARLFNKSGAPDYSSVFPDRAKFPMAERRLKEWKILMEIVEVDRVNKRSRVLKHAGDAKCSLSLFWEEHPEWPDWQTSLPERPPRDPEEEEKWRIWAKNRSNTFFKLIK